MIYRCGCGNRRPKEASHCRTCGLEILRQNPLTEVAPIRVLWEWKNRETKSDRKVKVHEHKLLEHLQAKGGYATNHELTQRLKAERKVVTVGLHNLAKRGLVVRESKGNRSTPSFWRLPSVPPLTESSK